MTLMAPPQRSRPVIEVRAPNTARRTMARSEPEKLDLSEVTGYVVAGRDGTLFLRPADVLLASAVDVLIPSPIATRRDVRPGDHITGVSRARRSGENRDILVGIGLLNHRNPDMPRRPLFEDLVPIHPDSRFRLEHDQAEISSRIIDLIAPIGRGQRALIVSPPKAGKTILLTNIAAGITANHPEARVIVALVGERPEEVTEMRRHVTGEVFASTFDAPTECHTAVAERVLDVAKRSVEEGYDVVVLLDSITRLARAYNLDLPTSGKTLSGGMDSAALYPAKHFFGAARKIEDGGSLTIIATCLIDTGSRMDDVIYEEFKGTGNCEIHLDRSLAERRIFPALSVDRSGTRREELLVEPDLLRQIWLLRRMLAAAGNDGYTRMLTGLTRSPTNASFLSSLGAKAQA